jgi:hypothetical protein
MKRAYFAAGLLSIAIAVSGCTQTETQVSKTATIGWTAPTKRVLLVEPDVKLGELGAGGSIDWRADWSKTGTGFVAQDIKGTLAARGIDVAESGTLTDPHQVQLVKLHDAVGGAILLHTVNGGGAFKLPTKSDPLDFTLGPGVKDLHDKFGADYAMFVTVRDSYTTTGRAFLMLGMAALGVGISGGQQAGFVTLVDLRTGNVVWFNWLTSQNGDLRTPEPAQKVVDNLMKGLPL